jgi:hypothetical protein
METADRVEVHLSEHIYGRDWKSTIEIFINIKGTFTQAHVNAIKITNITFN